MTNLICPYCGSENTRYITDRPNKDSTSSAGYHCEECDRLFDEEDIEVEEIRHFISVVLDDTDEQHPRECDIVVGEHEAQGLSGLELPVIDRCFQLPGDGTMWFHIQGCPKDEYMNFDDFDIHDLRVIQKEI